MPSSRPTIRMERLVMAWLLCLALHPTHCAASHTRQPCPRRFGPIRGTPGSPVDPPDVGDAPLHVEFEVRQQIDLVEQHHAARLEHVRTLDRLILAFGARA